MPILTVSTNISAESVPSTFTKNVSTKIATLTGKPESYVMVLVNAGLTGCFGGSNEPFIYSELQSIGGFSEPNKVVVAITKLFTESFGVSGSRVYIKLTAPDPSNFGHNGQTFA